MNDISELETRITTALARISAGLGTLPAQRAAMDQQIAQLKAEAQKQAAQLTAAKDAKIAELQAELDAQTAQHKAALEAQNTDLTAAKDTQIAELQAELDAQTTQHKAALDAQSAEFKAEMDAQITQLKADADVQTAQIKGELEEERVVNTQLQERLKTVQKARADEASGLRADLDRVAQKLSTDAAVISRLRTANADLRSNNDALRTAVAAGVADGDLLNRAMDAELGGLKAAQAADRAELDAILTELGQLIADNDPSGPTPQKETTDA